MKALKTAHEKNKNARWWIKADATDVNQGLRESMKNEWSGDVDLGDNCVILLHKKYIHQLEFIRKIGLKDHRITIIEDLNNLEAVLIDDKVFLEKGLEESKEVYNKQLKKCSASEQSLFALAWDVDGFEKLVVEKKKIKQAIVDIKAKITMEDNVVKELKTSKEDLERYTKGLFSRKREAASHLLVFMISDEPRMYKPYAVPVRVLTYTSITDDKVQSLKDELKDAMTSIGMKVVGKFTIIRIM